MEKHFVTYKQALDLKDLGFKGSCFGEWRQWDGGYPWLQLYQDLDGCSTDDSDYQYTTEALAPLKSQVFEWFREKHNFIGVVGLFSISNQGISSFEFHVDKIHYIGPSNFQEFVGFKTYGEAESACIDKLIEICNDK